MQHLLSQILADNQRIFHLENRSVRDFALWLQSTQNFRNGCKNRRFKTCCFFSLAEHPREKRDSSYQEDPRSYLDQVIAHWIYKIPFLIDDSVSVSEKDLRLAVAKRVTQVSFH